jgi:hypothetical protein
MDIHFVYNLELPNNNIPELQKKTLAFYFELEAAFFIPLDRICG